MQKHQVFGAAPTVQAPHASRHVANGCDISPQPESFHLATAETNGSAAPAPKLDGGSKLVAAEFFAGIGLVRAGLEQAGVKVVWANDIEPVKRKIYSSNFDASHYILCDIRSVQGTSVPSVDIATASFPCVDLSLAGKRRGLEGEQSGLFFEFSRVLAEMGERIPPVVMIENVSSFVSSRNGEDLRASIAELNELGYVCDILTVDARWFLPQSRPRLFIIGTLKAVGSAISGVADPLRSKSVASFVQANQDLILQHLSVPTPPQSDLRLADVIQHLDPRDALWWDDDRLRKFIESLSARHLSRLNLLQQAESPQWRTAYRRTRHGVPVWEIRSDDMSGCLRTARGGSSRQAVLEACSGKVRVRWMTPHEYARLQGVSDEFDYSSVSDAQALFGFGDAVCVPVIAWLAEHILVPTTAAIELKASARAVV